LRQRSAASISIPAARLGDGDFAATALAGDDLPAAPIALGVPAHMTAITVMIALADSNSAFADTHIDLSQIDHPG